MNEATGITAGEIFNYLEKEKKKTDVLQLKIALKKDNSALFLALGWLSREEKITITKENNAYFVALK